MIRLIQNEWMKIFGKHSSWVYAVIIIVALFIGGILYQKFEPEPSENWKEEVEQEIEGIQFELSNGDIDDSYREHLESQLKVKQEILKNNINPNKLTNWDYMKDIVIGITSLVTLFSVIIASGNIAAEYSDGTIKQLLIRPHKRWKILLSKYITINLYSLFLLFVLIVSGYIIGSILFENGSFSEKTVIETYIQGGQDPIITTVGAQFVKGILLYLPSLLIINTISFMLSTLFKNQSLAVGVGIFVLFLNSVLGAILFSLLDRYEWFKYIIFPHLDLQIYLYGNNYYDLLTLPFSLTILAVYYIIFMVLTFTYFQKRDITF